MNIDSISKADIDLSSQGDGRIKPVAYDQNDRASQRDIIPTAIKTRNFGNIILESASVTGLAILNNGDSRVLTLTSIAKYDATLLAIPDMSLYVGSVALANQLPGGANVTPSQWQVIFMGNDWGKSDGQNVVTQVYVRNISAGASKSVILVAVSRGLANIPLS